MKTYIAPVTEVVAVMSKNMILSGSARGYNLHSTGVNVGMGGTSGTQIPQ